MMIYAQVTANNVALAEGDNAEVLIDGSETPVTAKGVSGYIPHPGDRLLVQRVQNQVEIVQTLDLGALPYTERWRAAGDTIGFGADYETLPIPFPVASSDTAGITYTAGTGVFTMTRAGKYVIAGQITMSHSDGGAYEIHLLAGVETYTWPVPTDANVSDLNSVTFIVVRKLSVGGEVSVSVENIRSDLANPPHEEVKGSRSRTRISITWIAD